MNLLILWLTKGGLCSWRMFYMFDESKSFGLTERHLEDAAIPQYYFNLC